MKFLKNCFIIIPILFYCIAAFGQIHDAGKFFDANVVQKTMPNGINILMLNRGYTPTLALLISFRAGSVDESYNTTGAAHMLEHMLFKGTDIVGTTDFKKEKAIQEKIEEVGEKINKISLNNPDSKELEKLKTELKQLQDEQQKYIVSSPYSKIYAENGGVGFNASTSKDITTYYLELPATKLELWADLELHRLLNPVFREFYIEKDAVLEERLNSIESKGNGSLFEQFAANAFMAHPYRHPIIGWRSGIENFTIKSIRDFYKKNYTASRMTITIVGKQNTDATYKTLLKYFGKLPKGDDLTEINIKEPKQKGERRFYLSFQSNPYLIIGWHKPTVPNKTDYVLDVISDILTEGKTSRLYKSLVIEKGLAASIDTWNGFPGARYDNLFLITAMPKSPATPEKLEQAIYDEIAKLINDLKEEEIKKILTQKESSLIFQMDNNMGIARMLSYYQTNFKDWRYLINYLNILKTISGEEIKEALRTYLTHNNRTVGILRDTSKKK